MLLIVPLVAVVNVYPFMEDLPYGILLLAITFFGVQFWTVKKNAEKRETGIRRLPIPAWQVAGIRIAVIFLFGLAVAVLYGAVRGILNSRTFSDNASSFGPLGFVLVVYSVYYIVRALLLDSFRIRRYTKLTKDQIRIVLVFFLFGINVLGLYLMIRGFSGSGIGPGGIRLLRIARYMKYHPWLTTPVGMLKFLGTGLGLGLVSVLTYCRRRSYLE